MLEKRITVPFADVSDINDLKAGDMVLLSGTIYTARDAAHKRMAEMLAQGETPPFDFDGNVVFYAGPCPAKPGQAIGSVGPTTAGRMDSYAPMLIQSGLRFMIGKGSRSKEVHTALEQHGGIYFITIAGAAAYIARCVKSSEVIAFEDLGTEAIRKLEVFEMPVIVDTIHA